MKVWLAAKFLLLFMSTKKYEAHLLFLSQGNVLNILDNMLTSHATQNEYLIFIRNLCNLNVVHNHGCTR